MKQKRKKMARDIFGNRKLTKEDKYTKNSVTFSRTDEMVEYFKMVVLCGLALTYLWYIFK